MRRTSYAYLLAGLLVAPIYFSVSPDVSKLVVWPVIGWSSVAAVCLGIRKNKPTGRGSWYLLALGAGVFIAGDNLYSYKAQIQDSMTFPSIVDVVYLCMYPCMIAGLAGLVRRRTRGRDWESVVDAAIVTAAAGLIAWVLLIAPLTRSDMGLLARLTSIAYPIGDIAILALLLRLAVGSGKRPKAFWLLVFAVAPLIVADLLYGYLNLIGRWHEQHPVDAGWIAFYIGWGAAALHPSMAELSHPAEVVRTRPIRLIGVGSVALVPPIVLIVGHATNNSHDEIAVAVFSIVIFSLVLARIAGLTRQLAAHESEARFEGILQFSSDAIFVIDRSGFVGYQSPSAENMFGSRLDSLSTARVSEFFAPHNREELCAVMTAEAAPGSYEWQLRSGDGWRDVDVRVSDLRAEPTVRGVVFTLRDITERNRLAAEREQALAAANEASRQKSVFLANMSHEIRTPLNGVMGMIGLLSETTLDSEQREYAETMAMSADCLMSIVNDVLDFSRIEAGRLEIDRHPYTLRTALEAALSLGLVGAQAKGLELVCVIDPDVPDVIVGDRVRLRQVVGNLVSNATKFTHAGEVVLHASRLGDGQLCISVRDTGIGIAKSDLGRLFEQYVQADDSTTRRYGGSGLGLAISKQLVELMGGRIGVESTAGEGSTFWFTLPLVEPTTEVPARRGEPFGRRRVLVVSAQPSVRRSLVATLDRWGVAVVETADAAIAKRLVLSVAGQPDAFDGVIIDERILGAEDACGFARDLRGESSLDGLVLIGLSARARKQAEVEAANIDACLTKPVRGSALFDCLAATFGLHDHASFAAESVHRVGHLLVVDDNVINQKVIIAMLRQIGYTADVAADGIAAVEMVRDHSFDAVLMDCQMPRLNGLDATRAIRKLPGGRAAVPVIAMTASLLEDEDRDACLAAGMNDFVGKPIDRDRLATVLRDCIAVHAS